MKIKEKDGQLQLTSTAYQAKNGALYINWGNTAMVLPREFADIIAMDIPNFDMNSYNLYY